MVPAIARKFDPHLVDEYDPKTGNCTVDEYTAAKDPYRIVHTRATPTRVLEKSKPASKTASMLFCRLATDIKLILSWYMINVEEITIRSLGTKLAVDTVIIESLDEDTNNWKLAADEIHQLFVVNSEGHVVVEIRNPKKMDMHHRIGFFWPGDKYYFKAWLTIQPRIMEVVKKELADICSSVTARVYSKGFQRRDTEHIDPRFTVAINCYPEKKTNFAKAEAAILAVMDCKEYPDVQFHLEMESELRGLYSDGRRELSIRRKLNMDVAIKREPQAAEK